MAKKYAALREKLSPAARAVSEQEFEKLRAEMPLNAGNKVVDRPFVAESPWPIIISGICVCGHSWRDHHLGLILNAEALARLQEIAPDHPPYVPQECEAFGSNETGGMQEVDGVWVDHCRGYRDKSAEGT